MNTLEASILQKFKSLIVKRVKLFKLFLFGSRARGDAEEYSDMDVLVVLEGAPDEADFDYVSDCAWEAGFEHGIVIVPVVYTRNEWENSARRRAVSLQRRSQPAERREQGVLCNVLCGARSTTKSWQDSHKTHRCDQSLRHGIRLEGYHPERSLKGLPQGIRAPPGVRLEKFSADID